MITKTQIIKKLKKYGFYSLNRAPYIYDNGEKLGLYFTFSHPLFGNLERVIYFNTEEELEKTIFEYWWFKENKTKYNLEIEFDDYETLTPHVTYKYNNILLDMDKMKSFNNPPVKKIKKDKKLPILQRQALILILILENKLNNQVNNFLEVVKLKEEKESLKEKLANKLANKEEEKNSNIETLSDSNPETDTVIQALKDNLDELQTSEEVGAFINSLLEYMQNVEQNEGALQNTYLIIKENYEIEDYKAKLTILDNLKNKKKLFKNKLNLEELFQEVNERSNLKTIVNFKTYLRNEQSRIQEVYTDLQNVEKEVIGDYLANFEKLNIDVPKIEQEDEKEETTTNKENIMIPKDINTILRENFNNLSSDEESACIIASSFLKDLVLIIKNYANLSKMDNKTIENNLERDGYLPSFKNKYQIIADFTNINIRVKYMKILKIDTFANFLDSLKEVVLILNNLNFKFNDNFYGYDITSESGIISLNLKNLWSKTKDQINIVKVLKNTPIYYSPVIIKELVDVYDNNNLSVLEQENVFLYKDDNIIKDQDKLIVAVYEKDNIIKDNNVVIIKNMKLKNKTTYYFKEIFSGKEEESL